MKRKPPTRPKRLDYDFVVADDQTVALRRFYASKRVHGKMATQCQRGCGAYLTTREMDDHQCFSGKTNALETKRLAKHKTVNRGDRNHVKPARTPSQVRSAAKKHSPVQRKSKSSASAASRRVSRKKEPANPTTKPALLRLRAALGL